MQPADELIVLVGGRGTRLRDVVPDLPKPLAPVAGRPFLAYLLDSLCDSGIRRVILATGYLADIVEQTIGRKWNGMSIDYSREHSPLGTGGAVGLAARMLGGSAVHVANGDTFLRFDCAALERCARANSALLGVALATVPDTARYGAVELDGPLVASFHEKGGSGQGFINAGNYYLTAECLAGLPAMEAYSFETDVLVPATARRRVAALRESSDFIDIGVPEDYVRAQQLFRALE